MALAQPGQDPLFRESIAPLAQGMRDVLGAMLGGGLTIGAAEAVDTALGPYLGALGVGDLAFPVTVTGPIALSGAVVLSGPVSLAIVAALMGERGGITQLDEIHIPPLRDAITNVIGRWATVIGERYGVALQAAVAATGDPRQAGEQVLAGPLASSPQVTVTRVPVQYGDQVGTLALVWSQASAQLLITQHPAYVAPAEVPMTDMMPPREPAMAQTNMSRPQFQQLGQGTIGGHDARGLDLLMDVSLTVSVELGRKEISIREILELTPGSLIELDRLAGEPLDLLINGKLFAKGEVVVIDESFGIRITSIVSPEERLMSLR
ncbi:MAG: flagellar motor switch protein FliN [bacterium]